MTRPVACLVMVALVTPALYAQRPDREVVQARRAFVAAVNVGSIEVLESLLAEDVVLSTSVTTGLLENAAVAPAPARLDGRDAIIAYFTREFASGRIRLEAQQSRQSGDMVTESGTLRYQRFPFSIGSSTEGEYRIALMRTGEGWRITDVEFESETGIRRSSPGFGKRPPVVEQPKPAPPPRREPLPAPRFGVVPIALTSARNEEQSRSAVAAVQNPPVDMPTDFAFRAALSLCGGELIVDTFTGTLARTAPPAASMPLVLSRSDLESVSRAIDEMQFFALPMQYVPMPPPGAPLVDTMPSSESAVRVRRNGQTHEVRWHNGRSSMPPDPTFLKLRALNEMISRLVAPSVAQMPKVTQICL